MGEVRNHSHLFFAGKGVSSHEKETGAGGGRLKSQRKREATDFR